ncbi:MAG: ribosome small subunit-dependent GTPase A [Lachnospiraceae bacterium]|nr:ribosome small subunit-dependent GTPase A [Lachnospiraceae bacterium]
MPGRIIKGVGGFYYVHTDEGTYTCRAKGLFRLHGEKPLVGDIVDIDIISEDEMEANVCAIHERKNTLIRPNVANVDQALIIFSLTKPEPNFVTLDKMILQYLTFGLQVSICFNKEDLADDGWVSTIVSDYRGCGCPIIVTSAKEKEGIDELTALLAGKTTVVAGPSGVGKSSLINCLTGNAEQKTGEISEKLARGKHTTRHSEIIPLMNDTYIIDTPGFGSFELFDISPENLSEYYEEFNGRGACRFMPCSHTHEPECAVKAAVDDGLISQRRYDNYVYIYDGLKKNRRH